MNSFTTKYVPDEGNPVIKFELVGDQLEFHINDTPWNEDSVQSYDLTKDETDQLRQLLCCSSADNDKVDDVYRYHFYIEANGRYRHGVIVYDSLFTENMYDDLINWNDKTPD
jgi:hypothetical protein